MHFQGVGRDSPDGKPVSVNEFEEKIYQELSKTLQRQEPAETPVESWLDNDLYKLRSSSISSDSLSPKSARHEVDGISESPSGKFLQLVENGDRELKTSSSQTDLKDLMSTASQTDLLREIEKLEREISCVDKATATEEDIYDDGKNRRRKSGVPVSPVPEVKTPETTNKPGEEGACKPTSEDSDSGKLSVTGEKEKTATNLWRKKLSVAFKIPDEFESYESATGMALENSVESKHFVDGVSLRVRSGLLILRITKECVVM